MRNKLLALAPLALATQLLAGGFYLQLGNPEASKEALKAGAVLTVKAAGCHDPATAKLSATAVGIVNGERREIPLKVVALQEPGFFAIPQQWPKDGKWVLHLEARNGEQFTNTLVAAGPNGVDRTRFKADMKQFSDSDVEAMLK